MLEPGRPGRDGSRPLRYEASRESPTEFDGRPRGTTRDVPGVSPFPRPPGSARSFRASEGCAGVRPSLHPATSSVPSSARTLTSLSELAGIHLALILHDEVTVMEEAQGVPVNSALGNPGPEQQTAAPSRMREARRRPRCDQRLKGRRA